MTAPFFLEKILPPEALNFRRKFVSLPDPKGPRP
jgi:hypothetical protein